MAQAAFHAIGPECNSNYCAQQSAICTLKTLVSIHHIQHFIRPPLGHLGAFFPV